MRLLVVVDVRLYREWLAKALARRTAFKSILAVSPTEDIGDAVVKFRPELMLVDMLGGESLGLIRTVNRRWPDLKIAAFGVKDQGYDVVSCVRLGVRGLVPRDASLDELVEVISSTSQGEFCYSSRAMAVMARHVAATSPETKEGPIDFRLTARERDILRCLAAGQSNKGIARELGIEVATVKNHVHNVLEKLGVKCRAEAVARLYDVHWFADNPQ